jgi:uncharacterized lipoprotein YddW (UPF0748 family)
VVHYRRRRGQTRSERSGKPPAFERPLASHDRVSHHHAVRFAPIVTAARAAASALFSLGLLGAQAPAPPDPPREFRGVWIATVDNIDWPSKPGLPADAARAELDALFDRAQSLRLNAVVLQVRPMCDALYPSELEPWSEWLTGTMGIAPKPSWDPLAHAVEAAHARGLELHAWFNPFRARHNEARSPLARDHVARRQPRLVVEYGDQLWMDPGEPRAREHSLRVIRDVVRRYDVDGVHLDDYFYPYPVDKAPFPDDASYARYKRGGGELARADWRRANVDAFVQALYREVKAEKPWCLVGISPFGIARPGRPAGIAAGIDQYEDLAADVERWLDEGWTDYLAPQLYWPIDQKAQSFATLLRWWARRNPHRRHMWPGLFTSRAAQGKAPWRKDELPAQIELIRGTEGSAGHIHFSARALGGRLGPLLGERCYEEAALVPASPWLAGEVPPTPEVTVEPAERGRVRIAWRSSARFGLLSELRQGRWRAVQRVGGGDGSAERELAGLEAVAWTAVGPAGATAPAVVVAVR